MTKMGRGHKGMEHKQILDVEGRRDRKAGGMSSDGLLHSRVTVSMYLR